MIKEVIRLFMTKHFYSINNQLFRQTQGAGIGNAASEKLQKGLLKRFDRKFMKALKKCKVEVDLYGRFVDDIMTALASLDPGVGFEEGKMTFSQDRVEEDSEMSGDARTFRELVKVANSIYKCVQFTSEVPSSQQEGKVPVLDLQLYVGEGGTLLHEFYEKPVSCPLVIPHKSATRMKLAVMVEEGVRRLRNHSRGLDWEKSRVCMQKFAMKLRRNGYPQSFRHQVIQSALERWRRMCKEEDDGVRPVHRPREWKRRRERLQN